MGGKRVQCSPSTFSNHLHTIFFRLLSFSVKEGVILILLLSLLVRFSYHSVCVQIPCFLNSEL